MHREGVGTHTKWIYLFMVILLSMQLTVANADDTKRVKRARFASICPFLNTRDLSNIPVESVMKAFELCPVGTMNLEANQVRENAINNFVLQSNSYRDASNQKRKVFLLQIAPPSPRSSIQGYWLVTAPKENKVLNVPDNEDVKFIFTGELQGCSVYAKINSESVDFFHYNRPALESLYLNRYRGSKIVNIPSYFVNVHGEPIVFNDDRNLNPPQLYNSNGVEAHSEDDPIVNLREKLFYKDKSNRLVAIKRIGSNTIDKLIATNEDRLNIERDLRNRYDVIIGWEKYMNQPVNYPLLMRFGKLKKMAVTGLLHRKNINSPWRFYSQRIAYTGNPLEHGNAARKMFNVELPFQYQEEIRN